MSSPSVGEYVESKQIKRSELQKNFKLVKRYESGEPFSGCCGEHNFHRLPAGSWGSAFYCWACKSIIFQSHQDRMGGITEDIFEVFQ